MASERVPDDALFRARGIINEMLTYRPAIRAQLIALGSRVSVISNREVITDIPEFRDIYQKYPGVDWNEKVQGGGLTGEMEDQTTAIWESNLLCDENDVFPREDILVREFSRTILNFGIEEQQGGREFRRSLEEAYRQALGAGLWDQTDAGESAEDYWAEAVQSWFGLNDWAIPVNGVHNQINTRHELRAYDPGIAGLIKEVFGETVVSSTCHAVAVSVHVGKEATFEFLGEVSPAKQAEVRALAADIRNAFAPYASGKPLPASLVVSYNQAMLKERFREVAGYEYPGNICGLRGDSLFVFLELPCGRPGVFAHEYFHHFLQATTAPGHLLPDYGEGYSDHGPWWLTEGAAVYGEMLYEVASGSASYDDQFEWRRHDAQHSARTLAELETHGYFNEDTAAGYALGFLAVDWLVQNSSEGALLDFYELLLEHDTWQAAFENAFGITVGEFYESFEEHRTTILPTTYRIAGKVFGPAGEPLQGIGVWAWQSDRDNSRFGRTALDGTFDMSILDGSFTLAIYGAGSCFLGWFNGGSIAAGYERALRIRIDGESVGGIEIKLPAHPDVLPCL